MLRLDHVMYVVADLDAAARRIRFEHGLDSYPGGEHVGFGTHNRIIPIGPGQYVELMAVKEEDVARGNPVGRFILDWTREGEGLRVWCVATDDIDAVAARLNLQPRPWTRALPDGGELRWRLVGAEQSMADPSLPFFIQWDSPPADHPSGVAVDHTVDVEGVSWLEVGGDAGRVARWTDHANLPVRIVDADEGPRTLAVSTAGGEVLLK
jgi:hypothetical protein